MAEWLLDDDSRPDRAAGRIQIADDLGEESRRDSQVVERMTGIPELPAQGSERLDVIVRALDVSQSVGQFTGRGLVRKPVRRETVAGALREALQVARTGHPHDRQVEALVADQAGQRGEDLLEGEIASGSEEYEGVRAIAGSCG